MSLTTDTLKSKHGPEVGKLFRSIQRTPEVSLSNKEGFLARSVEVVDVQAEVLLWNYERILNSLAYGNSFIGHDYFVLRYESHELLTWWHILQNEQLPKADIDTCKLEIETHFYLYLNLLYNLKEKFETLVGFKGGTVGDLVLNEDAAQKVISLFKLAYPSIDRYCKARGYIVHGVYEITLDNEHSNLYVSCSPYDLLPTSVHEVPHIKLDFPLSDDAIVGPVACIYQLTTSIIKLLCNLDNVDAHKLAIKFAKFQNGNITVSF